MSADVNAKNRGPITAAIMAAILMNSLDGTIVNVALPHIQGSLTAAPDQIGWVLTSYIVAAAMATPVSGWLANRFGIKTIFMVAIAGFTVSSMLCGAAVNLPQLVIFRAAQGAFGAFTLPLSQAVLLNINPPERHARAIALWAMGAILGPIFGPLVGGYITDQTSWRWCFYVNLPIGALALLGVWVFMASETQTSNRRFDFLGFGSLILAVAGLQLMLDRGPGLDWFASGEIRTEALVAATAFWVFLTHTITAPHPFIHPSLLRDRNLVAATCINFFVGALMFGAMAIVPILMQSLMGYPVLTAGIINVPRGLGMMVSMFLAPRFAARLDMRLLLVIGLAGNAWSFWMMSHFDLMMGAGPLALSGFIQGVGIGSFFVPMTTLAFATVSPALRPEATAMYNLFRSLGASLGISVLQALATFNTQAMHASLAAKVVVSDPMVRSGLLGAFSPETAAGALALDAEINREAMMIAFLNDFRIMLVMSLICAPLILLLRTVKRAGGRPAGGPAK